MISFRRRAPSGPAAVDPGVFREAMSRPAVARELFLPLQAAWWDRGRFTLGRRARSSPRPTLRGVRLHEARPEAAAPSPARDTQADLCTLVASVAELRRAPGLGGLVLSDETVVGRGGGAVPGRRVVFGLSCPPCGRFRPEDAAAAECHRVIRRAADRAGYRVEHPEEAFDAATGFPGLLAWAGAVRLRRRTEYRWLLLMPLLLVPLSCVSRWLPSPSPPDADGARSALDKAGDGGRAPGAGGASSGSGSSGGAAGPKQSGGGNANTTGPTAPQGGAARQPAAGAGKEEDGPPTTIPSKVARPNGSGVGGLPPAFPWRNPGPGPGPGPWRVPGLPANR